MVSSVNKVLLDEVNAKAMEKVSSFSKYDTMKQWQLILNMKSQTDTHAANSTRPPKDLAILYQRIILIGDKYTMPEMHKIQFTTPGVPAKLAMLQKQVNMCRESLQLQLAKASGQGNYSSIPGLSQPGAYPSTRPNQYQTTQQSANSKAGGGQMNYPNIDLGNYDLSETQSNFGGNATFPGLGTTGNPYASLNVPSGPINLNAYNLDSLPTTTTTSQSTSSLSAYPQPQANSFNNTGGYPNMGSNNNMMMYPNTMVGNNNSGYGGYPQQQMPQQQIITHPPEVKAPTAVFNNNTALRTVICPIEIVAEFLRRSNENTCRKMETCGILAGKEHGGKLLINTLIIPKQRKSQDECEMTEEGEIELFETQISKCVMTLGWIHTHPQFDLFLSSVDLHNQHAYQCQLSEAIAIVYSPIVPRPGYETFRVKDTSMPLISACRQTGFHQHKEPNGGHCFEVCKHVNYIDGSKAGIKVNIIDLRK